MRVAAGIVTDFHDRVHFIVRFIGGNGRPGVIVLSAVVSRRLDAGRVTRCYRGGSSSGEAATRSPPERS